MPPQLTNAVDCALTMGAILLTAKTSTNRLTLETARALTSIYHEHLLEPF